MGRRARHSAKTGDQSIYKSRSKNNEASNANENDSDDDPMYDEVDRYHNRKEEESYLQLDGNSDDDGDSSEDDDGITKHREGVFDLGMGGSSDEDGDDDESDSEGGDERAARGANLKRAAAIEEALASSSDDASDSDEDEDEAKSKLLNWGDKKHSYYHGDTADLEIGQDVEDAYLEEEAGREVEKARLGAMDDADFMLGGDEDDGASDEEERKPKTDNKFQDEKVETIQSVKSSKRLSKLSKKEKLKLFRANHPELLPLVQHFAEPIRELEETTMVAAGTLLKDGVAKGAQEAEVCQIRMVELFM